MLIACRAELLESFTACGIAAVCWLLVQTAGSNHIHHQHHHRNFTCVNMPCTNALIHAWPLTVYVMHTRAWPAYRCSLCVCNTVAACWHATCSAAPLCSGVSRVELMETYCIKWPFNRLIDHRGNKVIQSRGLTDRGLEGAHLGHTICRCLPLHRGLSPHFASLAYRRDVLRHSRRPN